MTDVLKEIASSMSELNKTVHQLKEDKNKTTPKPKPLPVKPAEEKKKFDVKAYAIDVKPYAKMSDTVANIFRAFGIITGMYLDE